MSKRNVRVTRDGARWVVRPEGGNPSSRHRTQRAAVDAGRPIARRNQAELVIHRPDGRIRDKDSYGNDPHPPKDRKH